MQIVRPVLAATAATALLLAGAGPAVAGTDVRQPTAAEATAAATADSTDGITVGGLGTVTGEPDLLRLQLRVVAIKPDAAAALTAANAVAGRVRTALRQHGVALADIQTTQLNVSPAYAGKPAKRIGFQVVQGVTAQLRGIAGAGATITDVVRVGGAALRFDGVFFLISDESPLQAQARDKAFAQAKAKADQYARLTGRALGAVQSVQEDVLPFYYDGGFGKFASAASLAAPGGGFVVNPGVQRVDVRVVARWAFAAA